MNAISFPGLTSLIGFRLLFMAATIVQVLMSFLALTWIQQRIADTKSRIADCTILLSQSVELHSQHASLETEVQQEGRAVEQLRVKLPAAPDEAQFLQHVSELATSRNVVLSDFRPGAILEHHEFREMELRLRGEGPYAGLCRWIMELGQLPRMIRISQMVMAAPVTPGGNCTLDLTVHLRFRPPINTSIVASIP